MAKITNLYHFIVFLTGLILIPIIPLQAQNNYYWVGGQGKWSEISHWATTSGGTVIHNEIPDGTHNVIFDENSFLADGDTVLLDAANNVCRDFIWTNLQYKPVFTGVDTLALRIFGSMDIDTNMVFWYSGQLMFEDTLGGKTINQGGHRFFNDVHFNGKNGEWTLLNDLWIEDTLEFTFKRIIFNNGSLITNSFEVTTEGFISFNNTQRKLDISNSNINILGTWQAVGDNLTVLADNSLVFCTEFFTHINGEYLKYNDIVFNGPFCGLLSNNVRTAHNNVTFFTSGIVDGTCTIDSLIMHGNGMDSCIVSGTDSIYYANLKFTTRVSGVYHHIHKLVGDAGVTVVLKGKWNHVDTAIFNGKSYVLGMNDIDYLLYNTEGYMRGNNFTDKAVFSADGGIFGQNTFDSLTLTGGFYYTLDRDSANAHIYRQDILSDLFVQGACEGGVATLTSDVNTVQALLEFSGGSLTTEYLALRDIRITGEGPFVANNSIDLGNNTGWTINELTPRNLYWVGGEGYWNDRERWSLTSGGPGGECPPTLIDNAYFDANSFNGADQNVFANVKYPSCHDMDWSGAQHQPVFAVDNDGNPDTNNLRIYGSLTFIPDMVQNFRGKVFFESVDNNETVDMAGHPLYHDVYFRGREGGWLLLDNLMTEDTIKFHHGTLNTNGKAIEAAKFDSKDTTTRHLILGESFVTLYAFGIDPFTGLPIEAWHVRGPGFTMEGDKSTIISTAMGMNNGHVLSENTGKLRYNNIEVYGEAGQLRSYGEYCTYNLVDMFGPFNEVLGPCTIDSLSFYGPFSAVRDSDTIYAVQCFGLADTIAGGNHVIGTAHFYEPGIVYGANKIDTLYFNKHGLIQTMNHVDTAVFKANGEIHGINTFGKLTLTKGKKYLFEHDSIHIILDRWTANGDCTGSIVLQSTLPGREAYIRMANGEVELDYVSLRDMHASGNVPFKATNSVDIGNNLNWEITQPAPLGLFWVNGSGNWDNPYHWAAYSGGPGNYCVPKEIDHVYFDENSFLTKGDTVNINVDNAVCKSMYWQGSEIWEPFLFGMDTVTLTVYGSLFLNTTMTNQFHGNLVFEEFGASKNGKAVVDTIHTFNKVFNTPVPPPYPSQRTHTFFQGINNKYVFQTDFTTVNSVIFTNGHVELGGYTLNCGQFISNNKNQRVLDISNSTVVSNRDFFDGWFLDAANCMLFADNSTLVSNGIIGSIKNQYGENLKFNNIVANEMSVDVQNYNNSIEYNQILFNADNGSVSGNYKANEVIFFGETGTLRHISETNKVIFHGANGAIDGNHMINTAIFHARGNIINSNFVGNCTFFADGNILGINTFDTLTFTPGGTYMLQSNQQQTIREVFNVRGNNCFSIFIRSFTPGLAARIYMENGTVSGDFLELRDIAAIGGAEFFAGLNSHLINSTGWIVENAPGYIYGFGGLVQHFCLGTEYNITTENFNGTPETNYYWNGSTEPGQPYLTITEPGTYYLTIDYANDCLYSDEVVVEADLPPVVKLDEGPYCEGDVIGLDVFPRDPYYRFSWFDGSEEPILNALLEYSGNIWVEVQDTVTGCTATDERVIEVIETPSPDAFLGNDTILLFGITIELDAGPGDSYIWGNDDPMINIPDPASRNIDARGTQTGVEYTVEVWQNGCKGSGTIFIEEYPRCAAHVPDAFTPNGDGVNEILYVRGNGLSVLEFLVFDRYGKLMFQTNDITEGWDGFNAGFKHEMDVFTYYLKAICADGGLIEKRGNITLIR